MSNELVKYNAACTAIAAARNVDEVKNIHDKSIAIEAYAKQVKNKQLEIDAAEIRMRAKRRLGELIKEQKDTVGLNKGAKAGRVKNGGTRKEPPLIDNRPTLADIGISKKLSSEAQKIAAVPEKEFEQHIEEWRGQVADANENLYKRIIKEDKKQLRNERLRKVKVDIPDGEFDVIYSDPPWQYEHLVDETRDVENQYPTDSIENICNLKIPSAENAILFLWVPPSLIEQGLKVCKAWGFSYRTHIIWDKEKIGMGYFTRAQHELLFIARKGIINAPLPENRVSSIYREKRAGHSEKPKYFYDFIEKCYPRKKYLEVYAREKYNNKWFTIGNEV